MPTPPSTEEKLRIKFRKSLRKAYTRNVELDPVIPADLLSVIQPGETIIVRVDSTRGPIYWFSNQRLLLQEITGIRELLRYDLVLRAHYMFGDLLDRVKNGELSSGDDWVTLKAAHGDRVEIDLPSGAVALEGLSTAYWPTLHFFWWISADQGDANLRQSTSVTPGGGNGGNGEETVSGRSGPLFPPTDLCGFGGSACR